MVFKVIPVAISLISISFLLFTIELSNAQNYSDCVQDLKFRNNETGRFNDHEIKIICQREEMEMEFHSHPREVVVPLTANQSLFLKKLSCKTVQECLGLG